MRLAVVAYRKVIATSTSSKMGFSSASKPFKTLSSLSSGSDSLTSSSSFNLPCSTSCITQVIAMSFVSDATRAKVSMLNAVEEPKAILPDAPQFMMPMQCFVSCLAIILYARMTYLVIGLVPFLFTDTNAAPRTLFLVPSPWSTYFCRIDSILLSFYFLYLDFVKET